MNPNLPARAKQFQKSPAEKIGPDLMSAIANGAVPISILHQVLAELLNSKTSISAEQLWTYSPTYWKNKMSRAETDDEMLEVAGAFSGLALEMFCTGADTFERGQKEYGRLIKLMDRHAGWMVTNSVGMQDGYRLTRYWYRTILVQLVLEGSPEGEKKVKIIEKITEMFTGLGWLDSLEDCLNPKHDQLRTTISVKYMKTETEIGEVKIILEPCTEFPIGSVWRSKKGTEFEVNNVVETEKGISVVCQDMEPPYRLIPYGAPMVRGWKRVV